MKTSLIRYLIGDFGSLNERMRDEWVTKTLKLLPNGARILDAGAGEQRYRDSCSHLDYVSQDFGKYQGHGDGKGLQKKEWDTSQIDIVSDLVSIPEADGSFDAILCTEVLEHVPAPQDAIKEFSRLISPGGTLILTAPFCSLTHFSPYYFCNGFSPFWYERWLNKYGFKIEEITARGNYFEYLAQEMRRLPSQLSKYSRVSPLRKFLVNLVMFTAIKLIAGPSLGDSGSSEILCFGYHTIARKK